jgi:hypothetical protein
MKNVGSPKTKRGAGTKASFIAHLSRTRTNSSSFWQGGLDDTNPAAAFAWWAAAEGFSSPC